MTTPKKDYFSDRFIRALSSGNAEAFGMLRRKWFGVSRNGPVPKGEVIRIWHLLAAFSEARSIFTAEPMDAEDINEHSIKGLLEDMERKVQESDSRAAGLRARTKYFNMFKKDGGYSFTDKEFSDVQTLINNLRKAIRESTVLTQDHKRRLLNRLEAVQVELHKTTSDVDRFWGFIAEVGIVTRKFGEDVETITKNAEKLSHIVVKAVMVIEGVKHLPDVATKLLGH